MPGNKNILSIPVRSQDFFRSWVALTRPVHKLTDTESEVFACFLKHRHELSKSISDPDLLDKVLMSEDVKKKIREECNIKGPHFQMVMVRIRKKKVLAGGKFIRLLIPNLTDESQPFGLTFVLDIQNAG